MDTDLTVRDGAKTAELVELTGEQKLEQMALSIEENSRAVAVTDNDSYVKACQFELNCKAFVKEAKDYFKPRKKERETAWQEMVDREKAVVERVERVMEAVGELSEAWEREQERKRKEAEQAAQVASKKAADEEAQGVALALEAVGETELAAKVVSEVVPQKVILSSFIPKVKGIGSKQEWHWRPKNEADIKREYLCPNEKKIGQIVEAMGKNAESIIGGIEVWDESVRTRRAR